MSQFRHLITCHKRYIMNLSLAMKTVNRRRTPASNNRAHADIDACLKRKLHNPGFRPAYDDEDKRIEQALHNDKNHENENYSAYPSILHREATAKRLGVRQPPAAFRTWDTNPQQQSTAALQNLAEFRRAAGAPQLSIFNRQRPEHFRGELCRRHGFGV